MSALTDAEIEARRRTGAVPFWRAIAAGAREGHVVEHDGGVVACVLPCSPQRSIMNCVSYENGDALLAARDALAAAYHAAGVRAWTVWVLPGDDHVAEGLAAAGHVLDASPLAMGGVLAEMDLAPRGDAEVTRSDDWVAMARLNAAAYGMPDDDWVAAFARQTGEGLGTLYVVGPHDDPVSCAFIAPHEGNAEVCFVATKPAARGRGLASDLLRHALGKARDAGCETATLEASRAGRGVYARLGFRDLGELQLWELRR